MSPEFEEQIASVIFAFLTCVFGWEYHRPVKAGANIELKGSELHAA
jgi:hypothetical protein